MSRDARGREVEVVRRRSDIIDLSEAGKIYTFLEELDENINFCEKYETNMQDEMFLLIEG